MTKPIPPKPLDPKIAAQRAVRLARGPVPIFRVIDQLLKLDTELTYGKHKGSTVAEVIDADPGYIAWMQDEIAGIVLDGPVEEALREANDVR
jgi:hypothetical protein